MNEEQRAWIQRVDEWYDMVTRSSGLPGWRWVFEGEVGDLQHEDYEARNLLLEHWFAGHEPEVAALELAEYMAEVGMVVNYWAE